MECLEETKGNTILNVVKEFSDTMEITFIDGSILIIEAQGYGDGALETSFVDAKTNIKKLEKSSKSLDTEIILKTKAKEEILRKLELIDNQRNEK